MIRSRVEIKIQLSLIWLNRRERFPFSILGIPGPRFLEGVAITIRINHRLMEINTGRLELL
jgi:hypothetical protein